MPKTNIYVSASDTKIRPTEGEKAQTVWYLSVEPKKHSFPCIPTEAAEPSHYGATLEDASGLYRVQTLSATDEPIIVGNILVAEKVKTTPENVLRILKEKLTAEPSSLPSEQTTPGNSDAWIRRALHLLQQEKILDPFDVGEFMTFTHSYAANRATGDALAMVAYPRLNKNAEKKAKTSSFWVDYPMAHKPPPRDNIENNQRKYGGLM